MRQRHDDYLQGCSLRCSGVVAGAWLYSRAAAAIQQSLAKLLCNLFTLSTCLPSLNPPLAPPSPILRCRQLAWLQAELAAAEVAGERVIVAAHHQVGQGAVRPTHAAWNWEAIQAALLASPAFRVFLAGHDHMGGYACIDNRHFITLEALLEAPEGGNAYGVVEVRPDHIQIVGTGGLTSRRLAV